MAAPNNWSRSACEGTSLCASTSPGCQETSIQRRPSFNTCEWTSEAVSLASVCAGPSVILLFGQDHRIDNMNDAVVGLDVRLYHIGTVYFHTVDAGDGHALPLHRLG